MSEGQNTRDLLLRRLLTVANPFGPTAADEMPPGLSGGIMYDGQNAIDDAVKQTSPTFLIGRRGSGKTAFLRASVGVDALAIELNSPEILKLVADTISVLPINNSIDPTDRVSALWDACFTAAVCSAIWSPGCSITQHDSPEAYRFGEIHRRSKDGRATEIVGLFLNQLRRRAKDPDKLTTFQNVLDETELNDVPLWAARQGLTSAVDRKGCAAVVSLDSLDQYSGMLYHGGALLTSESLALQGLFRSASRSARDPYPTFKVRVSFPAELWHFYSTASSNPLKDFDNGVLLHWNNHELLQIAGKRFLKFLELYHPGELRSLSSAGRPSEASSWATLFLRYLPPTITNGLGLTEPTISYLMRHTQLLPRHFLTIMNHVFRYREHFSPGCISPADVKTAVAEAERVILAGVIDAYLLPYPLLNRYCDLIIHQLPFRFTSSDLHRAYNYAEKSIDEYETLVRMFVESGALGRYIYSTKYYQKADFEYLHPSRLLIAEDQELCWHPLFAAGFDSKGIRKRVDGDAGLPVLPLGSDPENVNEFRRYVRLSE